MHPTSTAANTLRQIALAVSMIACAIPATQAVASPLEWMGGERIQGSGVIKTQKRELAHFTGVNLSLPANMELRIGTTESVTIETDDNLLAQVETVIENGTLKIRPVKRTSNFTTRAMKIIVTAKEINRIALGGSGSIASDALKAGKLAIDLGGSGTINLKALEADTVSVSVGGSGNLKTGGGNAGTVSISIGGSGDVDLGQVKSREASVSVAGSGEATVWASDVLSVTIAGSGDVNYFGDPKISRSVVGSGGTKRLGGAPR
ncbi:head GIN domain-containing protein [Massilia sp. CF038]|uniref:head GIN domain-containing protein n=1 Tax=Massilia sp. CF038 TaxID=1881045 RepID=UPI000910188D|nr:head GIN domain-containing protein [Massilia sp. CF038]SHH06240.1 Putative auto-transporter adhesin, head GIN domain [Massilia sp. CF038]